ncbi:hypothetical protein Q1695_015924 [Nippostrongylus brasiliensis]|nr:hypothetical protein Q1695_015924 [Nippostrongylus brasiliensis]
MYFASVVESAYRIGGDCTARTMWQQDTVKAFHREALDKKSMKFDCDCAERAEGIAWATAFNANMDYRREIYDTYTTKLVGRPLWNQYQQVKCMLDKLRNQENLKAKDIEGRTFGCAYARYPKEPEMADNISQALTCVYLKRGFSKCE